MPNIGPYIKWIIGWDPGLINCFLGSGHILLTMWLNYLLWKWRSCYICEYSIQQLQRVNLPLTMGGRMLHLRVTHPTAVHTQRSLTLLIAVPRCSSFTRSKHVLWMVSHLSYCFGRGTGVCVGPTLVSYSLILHLSYVSTSCFIRHVYLTVSSQLYSGTEDLYYKDFERISVTELALPNVP